RLQRVELVLGLQHQAFRDACLARRQLALAELVLGRAALVGGARRHRAERKPESTGALHCVAVQTVVRARDSRRSSKSMRSTSSQRRWVMVMCPPWIRSVGADGTTSSSSHRSFIWPPSPPERPTRSAPFALAASSARRTFGELPLVLSATRTSPGPTSVWA